MRFGGFGGAAHYRGHTNCHICKCTRIFESNCTQEGSQGLCSVLGAWPGDSEVNQHFWVIFTGSMCVAESGSMQGSCEPQQSCFPCKYFMSLFVLKSWKDILISKVLEKWWSVMMWAFQFCATCMRWDCTLHSYTNTWECAIIASQFIQLTQSLWSEEGWWCSAKCRVWGQGWVLGNGTCANPAMVT